MQVPGWCSSSSATAIYFDARQHHIGGLKLPKNNGQRFLHNTSSYKIHTHMWYSAAFSKMMVCSTFMICEFLTRPCKKHILCLTLGKHWPCQTDNSAREGKNQTLALHQSLMVASRKFLDKMMVERMCWKMLEGLVERMRWGSAISDSFCFCLFCEVPQLPALLWRSWPYPRAVGPAVFCGGKCPGPVQYPSVSQGLNWTKTWPKDMMLIIFSSGIPQA